MSNKIKFHSNYFWFSWERKLIIFFFPTFSYWCYFLKWDVILFSITVYFLFLSLNFFSWTLYYFIVDIFFIKFENLIFLFDQRKIFQFTLKVMSWVNVNLLDLLIDWILRNSICDDDKFIGKYENSKKNTCLLIKIKLNKYYNVLWTYC